MKCVHCGGKHMAKYRGTACHDHFKNQLELVTGLLKRAYEHLDYCGYGDSWERECSVDLQKDLDKFFERRLLDAIPPGTKKVCDMLEPKTDIVRKVCEEKGIPIVEIGMQDVLPEDLKGSPTMQEDE